MDHTSLGHYPLAREMLVPKVQRTRGIACHHLTLAFLEGCIEGDSGGRIGLGRDKPLLVTSCPTIWAPRLDIPWVDPNFWSQNLPNYEYPQKLCRSKYGHNIVACLGVPWVRTLSAEGISGGAAKVRHLDHQGKCGLVFHSLQPLGSLCARPTPRVCPTRHIWGTCIAVVAH